MESIRRLLVGDMGLLTGAIVIGIGFASMTVLFGAIAAAETTLSVQAVPWRLVVFAVGFLGVWLATAVVLLGGGAVSGLLLSVSPYLGMEATRALSTRVPVLVRQEWLDVTAGYVLVGIAVTAGALVVRELFGPRNETHNPPDA